MVVMLLTHNQNLVAAWQHIAELSQTEVILSHTGGEYANADIIVADADTCLPEAERLVSVLRPEQILYCCANKPETYQPHTPLDIQPKPLRTSQMRLLVHTASEQHERPTVPSDRHPKPSHTQALTNHHPDVPNTPPPANPSIVNYDLEEEEDQEQIKNAEAAWRFRQSEVSHTVSGGPPPDSDRRREYEHRSPPTSRNRADYMTLAAARRGRPVAPTEPPLSESREQEHTPAPPEEPSITIPLQKPNQPVLDDVYVQDALSVYRWNKLQLRKQSLSECYATMTRFADLDFLFADKAHVRIDRKKIMDALSQLR